MNIMINSIFIRRYKQVISPAFKDQGKDGKFKIISFYAKSQRLYGVMVN